LKHRFFVKELAIYFWKIIRCFW